MTGHNAIQPLRAGDPARLGGHRLLGRIGRGGMGTVYLAEGPGGERTAIKVINPELADDETFRERFRREVESARRVRRFCTAPVIDARLDGEPLYIVTEYVDGPIWTRSCGPAARYAARRWSTWRSAWPPPSPPSTAPASCTAT